MERRQFMKMMALGTAAMAASCVTFPVNKTNSIIAKSAKTSKHKQWARENYKGMEALLMPSFLPDLQTIDEDGIRIDVQNSIRHGFFSVLCFPVGIGRSLEKHHQIIKVACDEAKGKILVGANIIGKPLADDIEMIRYCEKAGCTHLLITPHSIPFLRPKTEEDLFKAYVDRISATSLPVILYANVAPHYSKMGPNGIPIGVFDRLADLPNVVAVKVSQPVSLTATYQLCQRVSDRLLVGPTNLDFVPSLAKEFNMQWSGQWNVEALQSPDKRYGVEMMKLFGGGKYNAAMEVYARLEPAHDAFFKLQMPLILKGVHPWAHNKYFQWCVGGNGGLLPDFHYKHNLVPTLDAAQRKIIRETYHGIGIQTTSAPEEEFLVGKAAYARGVRAKDMTETPYYI
jgi:4-hydroxy-tetrahydrodipicolinate synthase